RITGSLRADKSPCLGARGSGTLGNLAERAGPHGPRRGDARGDPGRQARRRTRRPPAGDVEHAPRTDAAERGVDEPALRGVCRVVARLLPALGRCPLEPDGRRRALRAHLRSAAVDADPGRAVTALSRLALPRLAAPRPAPRDSVIGHAIGRILPSIP